MTKPESAGLKLGLRPEVGTRRIAGSGIAKLRLAVQHVENLLGVFLPVCRNVQISARFHAAA